MLLFLGDSITQWWDADCFREFFGSYDPLNLGMTGHTTKDTLEYVKLSGLNGLKPDLIILQIGTNNPDHGMTTGETVKEIKEIIKSIRSISSNSKILLIGPLPRGDSQDDRYRVFNAEVNKLLSKIEFESTIFYVDLGYEFLTSDSSISSKIMYDKLHLTVKGYRILSEQISSLLFILFGPRSTQGHPLTKTFSSR